MTIFDIILLISTIIVVIIISYGVAKVLDMLKYHDTTLPNHIKLLQVEYEILKYYFDKGYVLIEPRKFGGINGSFLRDGVKLTSPDHEDIILDKYFHLFEFIDKPMSIQYLLNK